MKERNGMASGPKFRLGGRGETEWRAEGRRKCTDEGEERNGERAERIAPQVDDGGDGP